MFHRSRGRGWLFIAALTLAVGTAGSAFCAGIHKNAGTKAFPSLKINAGAAAIGMGEAGVALSDDAYATSWNAAGLAKVRRPQIALMNNAWILDIRQNHAVYAQPFGSRAGIAVFGSYLDYGELIGRDEQGTETGAFRPYDLVAGVGGGYAVNADISVGAQVKYLRQQIDDASAQGVAVDVGARYDVPETNVSLGLAVQHLGASMKFDTEGYALPTNIRLGLGYRLLDDQALFAFDANFPTDNDLRLGVGFSYDFFKTLTLRGGYRTEWGGNELGGASGLTAGFGIHHEEFALDYAFVSYGDLGPTNRVSLSAQF